MSIAMIGIDHNRASVDERALFSFTKKAASEAMIRLKSVEGIYGCVILSTCNRMELWVSAVSPDEDMMYEFLCREKGVDAEEHRKYFASLRDDEAVTHLFRLTSGLESRILAEDQIITQVKDALTLARDGYCTDGVLEVLFRMAVTAAKRVKTEVSFERGNASVIMQAIKTLKEDGFDVDGKRCMVIGNGEMGRVSALALKEAGADVTVTVRQYRSGVVDIPEGCSRINYGERMDLMPSCDLVVSATASPNYTITRELVDQVTFSGGIVFIDLAVPRDIEASVAEHPGVVKLYDIDSFRADYADSSLKDSIREAEGILEEQMEDFSTWLSGRDLIPKVQKIQDDVVEDFRRRILKTLKKTPMDEEDRKQLIGLVDNAASKVAAKLLYGIRDNVGIEEFADCIEGLEKVYEEESSGGSKWQE